jgi:hypothetical protein
MEKLGTLDIVPNLKSNTTRWFAEGKNNEGNFVKLVGPQFDGFATASEAASIAELLGYRVGIVRSF